MTMEDVLRQRLAPLSPETMELQDDSALHAGHVGAREGGHYRLTVVSKMFEAMPRLARHREVMRRVNDLIPSPIHALSVRALTPDEFK